MEEQKRARNFSDKLREDGWAWVGMYDPKLPFGPVCNLSEKLADLSLEIARGKYSDIRMVNASMALAPSDDMENGWRYANDPVLIFAKPTSPEGAEERKDSLGILGVVDKDTGKYLFIKV